MKRLIVLLTVLVLLSGCVREKDMGIEFTGAEDQGLEFGLLSALPAMQGLNQKTIVIVFTTGTLPGGTGSSHMSQISVSDGSDEGWSLGAHLGTDGKLWFSQQNITMLGIWNTNNVVLTAGVTTVIIITYDDTSVANDPNFYIDNGAAEAITELSTPVGGAGSDLDGTFYLGAKSTDVNKSVEGVMHLYRVYNRIISAQEREIITNARGVNDGITEGLVFEVLGEGAATQQIFDGQTLAAADTIIDSVNGYIGVPAADPIGYADDYLHTR